MSSTSERDLILDENLSEEFDEIIDDDQERSDAGGADAPARSRRPIYIVGAILLVIAVIGLGWWIYSRGFVTTDDAFIEGNITLINAKLSAQVRRIAVKENQFVRKGDLLIELDSAEADARLAQAKAAYQTALANLDKARANADLTRMTGRAGLSQAASNLDAARGGIEATRIVSSLKENAIRQAQSQSQTSSANLKQVEAQVPAAEAAIEQARAQVAAAKNRLEVARIENEREQRLFNDGITSRQKLDQTGRDLAEANASYISAEKQVEIAQSRLTALRRQIEAEAARVGETETNIGAARDDYRQSVMQIGVARSQAGESAGRLADARALPARIAVQESEVASAQAEVSRTEAAALQAEIEAGYARVYAPQDGYVSRRAVQEGQFVQPEQSLMTITQDGIWVIANFKETQLEKLRPGQPVDLYVDAYPGTVFRGTVESLQAATGSRFSALPADNATGNFIKVVQRVPVKIVFNEMPDSTKFTLVPGMSVVPRVLLR